MVTRSEVKVHVQGFAKRVEEAGRELWSSVGGDMLGDTMLREDMHNKKDSEIFGGASGSCQNKDCLFGESINNN